MFGEVGVINMNNQMMNNNQMNTQINQGMGLNNSGQINQNVNQGPPVKKMSKAAQKNPKYTENWLPLKAISNGIMYNN